MTKRPQSRVSISDVARAAGISKAAAGFALQNKPEVSPATRKRVLRIARRLGYAPDPGLASWMARVRGSRVKEFQPIAWLNAHSEKDAWTKYKFLSPYLEGARDRARELGYKIEEIWVYERGMTMQRLAQMLYQQGIEGAIITFPARHFRLKWDYLAAVSLEGSLLVPALNRVTTDTFSNFTLMKRVKRLGYERIGVCLDKAIDHRVYDAIQAMTRYLENSPSRTKRIPPLFYRGESLGDWQARKNQVIAWLLRHKPQVIVGHSSRLVECVEDAGYRVPQDIGIVHLATDDDVRDWAGIFSNRRAVGTTAVEMLVSLIQNRQFGVPPTAVNASVRGTWQPGRTLLSGKSR
jgi:LacI family transcriptional regulator